MKRFRFRLPKRLAALLPLAALLAADREERLAKM